MPERETIMDTTLTIKQITINQTTINQPEAENNISKVPMQQLRTSVIDTDADDRF